MIASGMASALNLLEQAESAYRQLQDVHRTLVEIEEATKTLFEYGPFRLASDFEYKLRAVRVELIKQCAEALRVVVTPNAKLDNLDFVKMMDEYAANKAKDCAVCHSERDFNAKCLQNFFETLMVDYEAVQRLSLETIMKRVRHFLPYSNAGGSWDMTKDPNTLLENGNVLVLRCHSWNAGMISYNLNSDQEFPALHKAIEIALLDMDPATPEKYHQMTDHIKKHQNDPNAFYLTCIVISHPEMSRFRFFKNGTLKIWFKNSDYALRVAKFLIGNKTEVS